jgi:hypothetical protein
MNVSKHTIAEDLLEAIAETNCVFREKAVEIGRRRGVTKAITSCEIRKYRTGSALEAHLDAELEDGNAVSWLLEVSWTNAEWTIERKLVKSTNSGQDTIADLPTATIKEFEKFVELLPRMASELLALQAPELIN